MYCFVLAAVAFLPIESNYGDGFGAKKSKTIRARTRIETWGRSRTDILTDPGTVYCTSYPLDTRTNTRVRPTFPLFDTSPSPRHHIIPVPLSRLVRIGTGRTCTYSVATIPSSLDCLTQAEANSGNRGRNHGTWGEV